MKENLTDRVKRKKVAWGITGSGDRLRETFTVMRDLGERYCDEVDIRVYLSKAGEHVAKWYGLYDQLKQVFGKVLTEFNSNVPFLAGDLEIGKFAFLLIAPATSNTVAKIATGIADTLLCNSVIMALKASVPVYVMPSDYEEGTVVTQLPNGKDLKIKVRREDVENTRKLAQMDGMFVLEKPENIYPVFITHFAPRALML